MISRRFSISLSGRIWDGRSRAGWSARASEVELRPEPREAGLAQCADVRVIAPERFVDDSGNIVSRLPTPAGPVSLRGAFRSDDFVDQRLRIGCPEARPTRTASKALAGGVGMCRDTHVAVAL